MFRFSCLVSSIYSIEILVGCTIIVRLPLKVDVQCTKDSAKALCGRLNHASHIGEGLTTQVLKNCVSGRESIWLLEVLWARKALFIQPIFLCVFIAIFKSLN